MRIRGAPAVSHPTAAVGPRGYTGRQQRDDGGHMAADLAGLYFSRRRFVQGAGIAGLGVVAGCGRLPWPDQQATNVPRLGWLGAGSSAAEFPERQVLEALHTLGWADGKTVIIEFRHAGGNAERLSELASE